jgi:hypothetical protein
MGTLLQKMTADNGDKLKFSADQVRSVIEILIPRMATQMPGMPDGMTCDVQPDDTGWTLRINKP